MSKDNKELNAIEEFVIKCVEKIKASDDNKIKLAANQIVKTYNKEIAARERKIADIKTKPVKLKRINLNEISPT